MSKPRPAEAKERERMNLLVPPEVATMARVHAALARKTLSRVVAEAIEKHCSTVARDHAAA